MHLLGKAARFVAAFAVLGLVAVSALVLDAAPAHAACTAPAGGVVTCTGSLSGDQIFDTASGINDLEVNNVTAGPSRIVLSGTGAATGSGTNGTASYSCTITNTGSSPSGASCAINNAANPPTCTATNGSHQTATCVATVVTPAQMGPSGNSGPPVTVNVLMPTSGPVTLGAGRTGIAIVGFSLGSGGGHGGSATLVGNGGNGGPGVDGGDVSVIFTGIIADGNSGGILAQSNGGNGGDGGSAGSLGGSGGDGGAGGFGGSATASFNGGSITVSGAGNVGITAISQGGNGGNGAGGGFFVSGGGSGNNAGQAGAAEVDTTAGTSILTKGDFGNGIAAYSLGGGGGTGAGGFGLFYSGGGSGSTGGNGGAVTINANSLIKTQGNSAVGILAQSIGGGGGNAGTVVGLVALGAGGGGGGSGGTINLTNTGQITTVGTKSNAIEAQSIGGGGGNGSNSGGLFAMGGDGSGTTVGGMVTVSNSGVLSTFSGQAAGILAQSIGGGGGNGGTSGGLFAFGGSGGSGADGGIVTVTNSGTISTGINSLFSAVDSSGSPGILAQSIGGGGGNGGGAVAAGPGLAVAFGGGGGMAGNGSNVFVLRDNANAVLATAYVVNTFGDASSAVVAQSIGGGGGNGGFAVAASASSDFSVALGVAGSGAAGGSAGTVEVDTKGSFETFGASSAGILAQSIGGGGGNGGFSVAASVSLGASLAVSVGGTGGAGGDASAVTVSSLTDITTNGNNAYGISAQSLGGGGGNGGFSVAASGGIVGISAGVGGSGAKGGSAQSVSVTSAGNISTGGANAGGIAAQSIGGGGGNGGFAVAAAVGAGGIGVGVGGSGTQGGTSGAASIDSTGSIVTTGKNSIGLLAQSLGGGGGNGGFAATGTIGVAGAASVAVGGSGGGGQSSDDASIFADGGATNLTVSGFGDGWNLVTTGSDSAGIMAQTIGGGGGNGGFAGTLALSGGLSVGLSLGGSGGDGSSAGNALVQSGFGRPSANNIFTGGDNSAGIIAQSVGGGGGTGGFAVSLSGAINAGSAVAVTLGGSGGNGSTGGSAEADSVGNITTIGNNSDGVIAQSVGGGGGNGGFSVALAATTGNFGGAVAIGGGGGTGNDSSAVVLSSSGAITTFGQQSTGLFAQSIGGGGGNGGFAGAGALSLAGVGVAVGLGGSGAGGGSAGTVNLTNDGAVTTSGNQSSAIIAQSVGGGGGNGGSTVGLSLSTLGGASVAIGGGAGAGGDASDVIVVSTGDLTTGVSTPAGTPNNDAYGILAQSLGGGGGNGGFAGSLTATGAVGVSVSVGGTGGAGGSSGSVNVTSTGDIATVFDVSGGILAQSIGGGGGNGGFAIALSGAASIADIGATAAVSVGGHGGVAGTASDSSVTSTGLVLTQGNGSNGVAAQSIGGGGGNGGFSVAGAATLGQAGVGVSVGGFGAGGGAAGDATVHSYGVGLNVLPTFGITTLETDGGMSNGILAQSLGGGGGNGGFSVAAGAAASGAGIGVSVGGFGAGGGSAGIVNVISYNNILTEGSDSNAIEAQSVGGGGGNGGFSAAASGGSEFAGSVSVGGSSLDGAGDGKAVTVDSFGTLNTIGKNSNGILAQSLGGGGGNGGFSLSGAFTLGALGIGASVGGFGSDAGNGGAVTVDSYGAGLNVIPVASDLTIQTLDKDSNGILAQSIGGGGGNGGFSIGAGFSTGGAGIGVSVGGFGAGGGSASTVDVTSYNNILTVGYQSNAISAQSLGGGGGNGGFAGAASAGSEFAGSVAVGGVALSGGGSAGIVTVDSFGTLNTLGEKSNGILAQSIGGGGGDGGFALSGSFSLGAAGVSASVGGKGSKGGAGAAVVVNSNAGTTLAGNAATIETQGESANGIEAQSIGGGGGNGGFSGAFTATGGAKASLSLSVGGFGGAGNTASSVDVTSVDNILTEADGANGILAQSVGGGGGNGGFSFAGTVAVPDGKSLSLSASLGGFGGTAADAGIVTVDSTGIIATMGNNASGVIAQSLGGGGGNGGLSVAGTFNFASAGNIPSITASVGGTGGAGGAAGDVHVTRVGATQTIGDKSYGIVAQSIGGGGGNGGLSVAGSIGTKDAKQISASVGGFGGPGSGAGAVTVNNTGAITTGSITTQQEQLAQVGTVLVPVSVVTGNGSDGILAQSIGGGGGNGGFAFSGSIGPTGENTSVNIGLTLGGFGGSGGFAGNVGVTNVGLITTFGAQANGIDAQSIGGGGGNGGSALTGQIAAGDPTSGGSAVNVAVSVGGSGGNGNVAGTVFVEQTGGISTSGPGSAGILAQSIGGGGGSGGGANSLSLQLGTSCTFTHPIPGVKQITGCADPKKPSVAVQVDVGGQGGTANDGNDVTVINHSVIMTAGDSSVGIEAQSIGGGGGNGGQAIVGLTGSFPGSDFVDIGLTVVTLPISTTGFAQGLGKITVGGFGGAAGDGTTVKVTNDGAISTTGISSFGIEAQSLGGGGGNGGNASSGVTGAASIGGFGAASGAGGAVTVVNNLGADITTTGTVADAIFAQSVGGGGGNGGTAGGLIALGGFGGASGSGGTVEVDNSATLETSGIKALAILAQSIGGGGGNGGGTGLSGVAIGGLAGALGSTGDGGTVIVKNTASALILTTGFASDGIEAQSVGGGGGTGGGNSLAAAVVVGGHGGSSGKGGLVQIFNDGAIETESAESIGIFGQSIGGSGGNGGGSLVSAVSVGGFGGSSGAGGEVDINNTGLVVTLGAASDAIRGQSIGGGGGDAGGVGADLTSGGLGLGLLVSVGGGGGGGGNAGLVDITNTGTLATFGDKSDGIYAQSVGGGGGDGGRAIGLVAVGGLGGNTGDGGAVTVMNKAGGDIETIGTMSDGIYAQSVGGGGGNGGGAYSGSPLGFSTSVGGSGSGGGAGGEVRVDNSAQVETFGLAAEAIFAQSVGGGGGNGGIAGSFNIATLPLTPALGVSVGGNGGGGGAGGIVTVNNFGTGTIQTGGANSTGIFAQSVGGGGGTGGYAMTAAASLFGSVGVSIGGSGGIAGNGGSVNVNNDGQIVLEGNNSIGIMAQSVGGGGGVASSALSVAVVPVFIGGQTGATGTGGDVKVVNTGSIVIDGDNSIGIFAQSVGGGGGMVKPGGGATSVTAQSGGTGDGGAVVIENSAGSIVINGNNSIAMFMQSVGGGGGTVGLDTHMTGQTGSFQFTGSAGGSGVALATTLDQKGNLIATGTNSIALAAQSAAPGGNGDITLNILSPASGQTLIVGGLGSPDPKAGAGVDIIDGANNRLNNGGVISATPIITGTIVGVSANNGTFTVNTGGVLSTVSGTLGYAVIATDANNVINNTVLLMGSVDLGPGGINAINNKATGVFDSGAIVNVGAGNPVDNAGLLSPGGYDDILTTNVTGNLVQDASGTYGVDLNLNGPANDRTNVSGTATMSGTVFANLVDPLTAPGFALPGSHDVVIVHAVGGETHAGLTLEAFNTAVANYALAYPGTQDIDLHYVIDFSPSGLTANQHSVGNAVNQIQTAQASPAFRPIATNLFYLPNVATLGAAYDSLSGEGVAATQQTAFDATDAFLTAVGNQMRGQLWNAPDGAGHDWHFWLSPYGGGAKYAGDAGQGSASLSQAAYGLGFGADYQVAPGALVGAALGFGSSTYSVQDRATDGRVGAFHGGAYGAWQGDAAYVTGIVAYDRFNNSEQRRAVIPGVTLPASQFINGPYTLAGFNEMLQGHFASTAASGHFEAGYRNTLGDFDVTPFVGLGFSDLDADGFTEKNLGAPGLLGLSFAPHSSDSLPSFLGLQIDLSSDLPGGGTLKSWLRTSWKHEFDASRAIDSTFVSAPGIDFSVRGAQPPRDAAVTDLGISANVDDTVSISASLGNQTGGGTQGYTGTIGLSMTW